VQSAIFRIVQSTERLCVGRIFHVVDFKYSQVCIYLFPNFELKHVGNSFEKNTRAYIFFEYTYTSQRKGEKYTTHCCNYAFLYQALEDVLTSLIFCKLEVC